MTMTQHDQGMSQTVRAVLRLREALLSGEFQPGERVSEIPLSARLGVSRTPLRHALVKLEHEGLLERLPGGGFMARAFSKADIDDAIEVRGVLEGTAARLAAERLEHGRELSELRECSRQMEVLVRGQGEGDAFFASYMTLNGQFHEALMDLAKSEILRRALENIVSLPFASPNAAFVLVQARLPESREILVLAQDQHRTILEAIENREGTRAENMAREHARISRRNLEIALERRDLLDDVPGASLLRLR
jgi:GntR family transcriptional regulator of vanillate catabolism